MNSPLSNRFCDPSSRRHGSRQNNSIPKPIPKLAQAEPRDGKAGVTELLPLTIMDSAPLAKRALVALHNPRITVTTRKILLSVMNRRIRHIMLSPLRILHVKWLALALHPHSKIERRAYRERVRRRWFTEFAAEALGEFSDLLHKYPRKVDVWLEFGTLLGAYRENGIISHDTDIDLGIADSAEIGSFVTYLLKRGFRLKRTFRLHSNNQRLNGRTVEYTLTYHALVSIDLFVLDEISEDEGCYYCFDAERGLTWAQTLAKYDGLLCTHIWTVPKFSLQRTTFLGKAWNIPANAAHHLAAIYGADYMTPRTYSFYDRPLDREVLLGPETMGELIEP
jgi:hypothetical protein